jgi:serine/threonine protein kinase
VDRPRVIGRYALYGKIAAGGMATVHIGRLLGPAGFSRTVAIKRMHPELAEDPEFVEMFLDEARVAARIRHPNVVPTLDIGSEGGELFLVLEYVAGETLARLLRQAAALGEPVPVAVVGAIVSGVLHGLHAAHEAKDERGESLELVHRDVSPQNVLVGSTVCRASSTSAWRRRWGVAARPATASSKESSPTWRRSRCDPTR